MKSTLLAVALLFSAQTFAAGDCVLAVTRVACKGKEAESYKKCEGKATCDEKKKSKDAAACAKEALEACENVGPRQKITESKVVKATFDGAAVEGGKDFCGGGRPDFNKCDK